MPQQKPTLNRGATTDTVEMPVIEIARSEPGTGQMDAVCVDPVLWEAYFPPVDADMPKLLVPLLIVRLLGDAMKATPTIPANLERTLRRSFSHRFLNGFEDVAAMGTFATQCREMAVSAAVSLGHGGDIEVENQLTRTFYASMEREMEIGSLVDLELVIHPQAESKPLAVIYLAGHSPFSDLHGFHGSHLNLNVH